MNIETVKHDIKDYLSNVIDPIYDKFDRTKDVKDIKFLDEKLEVLQSKIDRLYELNISEAEDFYLREVGTLPTVDSLMEFVKRD